MSDEQYKFDVAFSFLAQDEPLANKLNDELKDRLSTFLYSEHQKQLAGTDGEEAFARVFRQQARTVVILYRENYGAAGWTRVESDAIRNRAHDDGYNFTLWVLLDKSRLPPWLPFRQLYYGLERFGVDGAVAAIETRVQEAGGDTRPPTFEQKVTRISRDVQDEADRKGFLNSSEGVVAAHAAIATLHQELKQRVEAVNETSLQAKIRIKQRSVSIACEQLGLGVQWTPLYGNTLDNSHLEVTLWGGPAPLFGDMFPFEKPTQRRRRTFSFDRDRGSHGWREGDDSKLLTTPRLADECMTFLLEAVREEQRKNRR